MMTDGPFLRLLFICAFKNLQINRSEYVVIFNEGRGKGGLNLANADVLFREGVLKC